MKCTCGEAVRFPDERSEEPCEARSQEGARARQNHAVSPEGAQRLSAEGGSMRGVGCPQTAGRYPPNEVSREAGAMRGASRSGAGLAIGRRDDSHKTHYAVDENRVAKLGCQKKRVGVPNWV